MWFSPLLRPYFCVIPHFYVLIFVSSVSFQHLWQLQHTESKRFELKTGKEACRQGDTRRGEGRREPQGQESARVCRGQPRPARRAPVDVALPRAGVDDQLSALCRRCGAVSGPLRLLFWSIDKFLRNALKSGRHSACKSGIGFRHTPVFVIFA